MQRHQYEAAEQIKLFRWVDFAVNQYPELEMLYHIPNGGSRNPIEAANLKRQGVRAGVPDLCLPIARGKYHGMYIEMKYGDNKPTENQKHWLRNLQRYGYATSICYSAEVAIADIEKYLNLEDKGK